MRIVIDLQGAQTESRFRGIGRYSTALAQAVVRNAGDHEVWLALNGNFSESIPDIKAAFSSILPANRIVVFNYPSAVSWESPGNCWRRQAAELVREHFLGMLFPDVVLISSLFEGNNLSDAVLSIGAYDDSIFTAAVLYDLIPLRDPDSYLAQLWVKQWYMSKIQSLKAANLLLSISDFSKQEAVQILNYGEENIVNISSAHTDIFRQEFSSDADDSAVLEQYAIARPFIMYNGALEPRKNLDRLLRAFAMLPAHLRSRFQLVLVGKGNPEYCDRLYQLASHLNIHSQLRLTGYVSDEELSGLFRRCSLFVFPSVQEGFGLPALEAMACGAPTIGSNTSSIPEVIGNEQALFDPNSTVSIAEKITEVLSDNAILQKLKLQGLKQAEKFSWDNCAKITIAAFEKNVIQNNNGPKNWGQYVALEEKLYRRLLAKIASIPQPSGGVADVDLVSLADSISKNRASLDTIFRDNGVLPEKITWRIEGPFDSSYSLALLNRETARALDVLGHHVVLHSTEGPGDFLPKSEFLLANKDIAEFYRRSNLIPSIDADVTSRNLYPPRVEDMRCRVNLLHHYAWEESGIPFDWVENFNTYLQGITCLSQHVKKVLLDNGVALALTTSGCGVDHWQRIIKDNDYCFKGKTFRFLHVSSCFPRKGVDVLLEAYGRAFTSKDDVVLVIKTFPNPHNNIHAWLKRVQDKFPEYPDVVVIEEDLPVEKLKALYEQCHVLVAPSRAEGFGLPIAEAMLSGLSVITTAWGGQSDFCDESTAWLVDYKFVLARTHFRLFDSVWAEPDVSQLAEIMAYLVSAPADVRLAKTKNAQKLLLGSYRWTNVVERLVDAARFLQNDPTVTTAPRIGWITSWNTRCGIASYSSQLVENIPEEILIFAAETDDLTQADEKNVVRSWTSGGKDDLENLSYCIDLNMVNILVVQFNYNFFDFSSFESFLEFHINSGKVVVVTLHSTIDPPGAGDIKNLRRLARVFSRCHRILVHAVADLNRLKDFGLVDNVALFPHGVGQYEPADYNFSTSPAAEGRAPLVISSYGFFLPHKGLLELIEALSILLRQGWNVKLNMINAEYPVPQSGQLVRKAQQEIKARRLSNRVNLVTDFLSDDESLSLLSESDLVVFPYQHTGESSSAAVRAGILTGKPVAVTPLAIFSDVDSVVFHLPGCTPDEIAEGIASALNEIRSSSDRAVQIREDSHRWIEEHRYSRLGLRMSGMLRGLLANA